MMTSAAASGRSRVKSGAIVGAAVLLAAAIGFQLVRHSNGAAQRSIGSDLASRVPRDVATWNVEEEPLGPTEVVNAATLKILNLDEYVYRRFSKGAQSFTVYVAYWAPGKMPTRQVASHTPDRCWTENGMRCTDMRYHQSYRIHDRQLLPAEYREFVGSTNARPMYVAYWHTVEGKLYDYGDRFNAVPSPWLWWKDTLAQAAYGSREQLFIRIASETPFETLWANKDFQTVMATVADLGLWAPVGADGRAGG